MYEFDQGTKTSDYQLVARAIQLLDKSDRLTSIVNTKFCLLHSPLKLEKSAISKVQKHIFRKFKNVKKSIFAPEKSYYQKCNFRTFLLVQKCIFCHF